MVCFTNECATKRHSLKDVYTARSMKINHTNKDHEDVDEEDVSDIIKTRKGAKYGTDWKQLDSN